MIGAMSESQSLSVLQANLVGRIGCQDAGKVYVVPVSYVFDKGTIYVNSKEGLKISMMRNNPEVCFQVDEIDSMANWRSVIVWGKFEELTDAQAQDDAIKLLKERFSIYQSSESVKPVFYQDGPRKERKPVVYRIVIREISGRFEKPS